MQFQKSDFKINQFEKCAQKNFNFLTTVVNNSRLNY